MKILRKDIKILTVSASSSKRQLVNNDLRARGYSDVTGAPDIGTAVQFIENGDLDWLITPVGASDPVSALQLLKNISEHLCDHDVFISLLVSDEERPFLDRAFELGLLSYHVNVQTKDQIQKEFDQFFHLMEVYRGQSSLVAGDYLRRHLTEQQRYEERLRFEKKLLFHFPGEVELLFALADAYQSADQMPEAKSVYAQILAVDADAAARVQNCLNAGGSSIEELPDVSDSKNLSLELASNLGVKRCLLVEPDQNLANEMMGYLKKLGVEETRHFLQSDLALNLLEEGSWIPELVVFEWALTPVAGPLFIQRVREILGYDVPVTVMNENITRKDLPLLQEMGITDRIKKPIKEQQFLKDVIWVINEDRRPSEPFLLLQKIRQALLEKNHEKVASLSKAYYESPKVTPADCHLVRAEIAYGHGQYQASRKEALEGLKKGGQNLQILNILGKALMKMREFEAALICLENAQVMSPKNIERICKIAEINLETDKQNAYEDALEQAKNLAPDSQTVQELEVKGALKQGDCQTAKGLMSQMKSLSGVVSFTNNRAVSLIRCARFDEGIKLYRDALSSTPVGQEQVKGVLCYNLGLAFARANQLKEAFQALEQTPPDTQSQLRSKVASLKIRIRKSLDGQGSFTLKTSPTTPAEAAAAQQDEVDRINLDRFLKIGPGDFGCYQIFQSTQRDSEIEMLFNKPFRIRRKHQVSDDGEQSSSEKVAS